MFLEYTKPIKMKIIKIIIRLIIGRQLHSCEQIDVGTVIVAGGRDQFGSLKSVELFDLWTSKWKDQPTLKLPGSHFKCN
jgi:hypothetical protein